MTTNESYFLFITSMISLSIIAFVFREWLRNRKNRNRWED